MRSQHVAVIGGAGRLGRYVVNELSARHEVLVLDWSSVALSGSTKVVDITVLDDLRQALKGVEAIVHVAGVDGHVEAAPDVFIGVNLVGTWNVLQAAAELGIRKVIITSSSSATGLNAADSLTIPRYLPIDEEHPLTPSGAYGLSKQINEITGASFGRRGRCHVVCIRPTYIAFPELIPHLRGTRVRPGEEIPAAFREPLPLLRTYVEPGDLARCYRLALEYESEGYDLFWASAADTFEAMPTLEYLTRLYGTLPPLRRPDIYAMNPHASVIDCSRAKDVLGWAPQTSWPLFGD
jgi:nucleoside-diphosphate-sugar epimerase